MDQASTNGLGIRLDPAARGFRLQGGSGQPLEQPILEVAREAPPVLPLSPFAPPRGERDAYLPFVGAEIA